MLDEEVAVLLRFHTMLDPLDALSQPILVQAENEDLAFDNGTQETSSEELGLDNHRRGVALFEFIRPSMKDRFGVLL